MSEPHISRRFGKLTAISSKFSTGLILPMGLAGRPNIRQVENESALEGFLLIVRTKNRSPNGRYLIDSISN